jgi:hypothetical protein
MESIDTHTLAKAIAKRHKLRTKNVNVLGSVASALEELLPDIFSELELHSEPDTKDIAMVEIVTNLTNRIRDLEWQLEEPQIEHIIPVPGVPIQLSKPSERK